MGKTIELLGATVAKKINQESQGTLVLKDATDKGKLFYDLCRRFKRDPK